MHTIKILLIGLVIMLAFVVTPVYATDSEPEPTPKAHNDIPTRYDDAPDDTEEDVRQPVMNGEGWEEEPDEDDDTQWDRREQRDEWNDDQTR